MRARGRARWYAWRMNANFADLKTRLRNLNAMLTADAERILGNLVDNALTSVRRGGHVLLEARAAGGGAPETGLAAGLAGPAPSGVTGVSLRVSDDGPGFPPGTLDRVFDRFYRADPSRTGGGSGLGLSIVRALATAHGGTATAENLAPTGARVTVVLPRVPPAPGV